MSTVKRTYGSRASRNIIRSSSPPSELASSSPASSPVKRKRVLRDASSDDNLRQSPPKKPRTLFGLPSAVKAKAKPPVKRAKHAPKTSKKLTQLHFSLDTSVLRTCPQCDLSYTVGAPEDEMLHRAHCSRVQRGLEWGREEERQGGVTEVAHDLKLRGEQWKGIHGRIVSVKLDVSGRIGSKLTTLLDTINLSLSSPALSKEIMKSCKAYLFLIPASSKSGSQGREKIAGCVIAQRIETAMRVASDAEVRAHQTPRASLEAGNENDSPPELVPVDLSTGTFVHPEPLPTPMGIPRLFVPSTYRRAGIAIQTLEHAARTFVHSCPLNARKGEVAFTQPTTSGRAVMLRWGGGAVRVYDEGQPMSNTPSL